MRSAVPCLAFGLHVFVCLALDCPSPFLPILGVCLNFSTTKLNYCDAQNYCDSIGGELVRGSSYQKIGGQSFAGMPAEYWIGMTDFQRETKRDKAGWRWSDGEVDPLSSGLRWKDVEPNAAQEDCTRQYSLVVWNHPCGWEQAAACQPRPQASSALRVRHFKSVSIPTGLSAGEFAEDGGCSQLLTAVKSKLKCAALCSSKEKGWCVSFYFNESRQECRLVLYTDATIDMGDAVGWKKFVQEK